MAKSGRHGGFWRGGGGSGVMALDFAPDAITLHERSRGNTWSEVGRAETEASDFAEQVDALRVEALVRDKRQAPVMLWLPADQIIERQYQLQGTTEEARRAEGARRIASETSHLAPELSVAVASSSRNEPVKVLAVLLQTMIEARSYAANWGFNPGPISTRVAAGGFSGDGPVFEFPHTAVQRAGRTFKRAAIAASALAVLGAAGFGGYHLLEPLLQKPIEVRSSGPAPSSFAVFLDPPPGPHAPLQAVKQTPAGSLAIQKLSLPPQNFKPGLGTLDYARIDRVEEPTVLTTPTGSAPLRVGTAPAAPDIGQLAALGDVPTRPATAETLARASDAGDGVAPDAAEETEDLTPTEFAPETMAAAPLSRPAVETEAEAGEAAETPEAAETAAADPHSTPAIPAERPAELTGAPKADDPTETVATAPSAATEASETAPAPTDGTAEAGAGDAEPAEELPSVFAAIEAPKPSKRPRTLEIAAKRLPKRSSTPLSVYLPKSVKDAARRTGLALDKTNLIGIIDAKTGREALLRLSDGQFRKVGRGDNIDGWRVSAIGREAVRLTRKGQHRTLLLVSP